MKYTCLSLVLILSASAVVAAEPESKQDFKCFITSIKGEKVAFFRWELNNWKLKMAKLPGTQLKDSNGRKYYIKSVEECVELDNDFTSDAAILLDKQTLR